MGVPTDVANLSARWKASTCSGYGDGNPVDSWTDSIGSVSVANTAFNRPVYRSSVAGLNGKPAVEFDRALTQGLYTTTPNDLLRNVTGQTTFVAWRTPATDPLLYLNNWDAFIGITDGTSIDSRLWFGHNNTPRQQAYVERLDGAYTTPVGGTSSVAINNAYIETIAVDYSGGTASTWRNGALDANAVSLGSSGSTSNTASAATAIGASYITGNISAPLHGYLAEVLVYSRVLTANERSVVHSYLQDEYGISVSDYGGSPTVVVQKPGHVHKSTNVLLDRPPTYTYFNPGMEVYINSAASGVTIDLDSVYIYRSDITLSVTAPGTLINLSARNLHKSGSPTLLVTGPLAVSKGINAHKATTVSIDSSRTLTVQKALHVNKTTSPIALTQRSEPYVNSTNHAIASQSPAITSAQYLVVSKGIHGHTSPNATLNATVTTLAVQKGTHLNVPDPVVLTQRHTLTVNKAYNVLTNTLVAFTQRLLVVQSARNLLRSTNIEFNKVLSISKAVNKIVSPKIRLPKGPRHYIDSSTTSEIITTGTDISDKTLHLLLSMSSRFAGDTSRIDAVRIRALAKAADESIMTTAQERMIVSDASFITDYRTRPQTFHRNWNGLYVTGGTGPIKIRAGATYSITHRASSTYTRTVTIGSHTLQIGDMVSISGLTSDYNGNHVVESVGATTVSYTGISSVTETTTADPGTLVFGYSFKTIAFYIKPISTTTTLFNFNGSSETLTAAYVSNGRYTLTFSGFKCYVGGSEISSGTTVDFTYPRLIIMTSSSAKVGTLNFGSTGGTGAVSSMSLNHIMIIPLELDATAVSNMYRRFYGHGNYKFTDTIGSGGSGGSITSALSAWEILTVS